VETRLVKSDSALEVKRVYSASLDQVYQAWIDPEVLDKWFHPSAGMTSDCMVDLRVGGRYAIEMHSPRGVFTVAGIYEEIIPQEKLVFTWQWQGEEEYEITRVAVLFKETEDGETELTLLHGDFDTQEERDSHGGGWLGTLDQLAAVLGE
jgi:uncharacterized protein YndB with AHSA1/START domain